MDNDNIFKFLCRLGEGIARMFGESCETLIQDMLLEDHPVLAIYNGKVTGREVGSTIDIYGEISREEGLILKDIERDFVNNLVITDKGRHFKSSTFHIKGEGYHYAFGINYDFTDLYTITKKQEDFMAVDSDLLGEIQRESRGLLTDVFESCLSQIEKPINRMNKADRLKLVGILKENQAFDFYKAVPYVAERLGVSRYTVYNYLKQLEDI